MTIYYFVGPYLAGPYWPNFLWLAKLGPENLARNKKMAYFKNTIQPTTTYF